MNLRKSFLFLALACGCLAVGFQQQPRKYVILDDKKGGFKIYDVESVVGTFSPDGGYAFEAEGSPLRGFSKQQGLTFSARTMEGVASRSGEGSFRIESAVAGGGVVLDTTASNSDGSTAKSHLETQSLTLKETDATTITIPGAFTYTNHLVSESVDRLIDLRAPGGTFVLPLLDQTSATNNPFRSANVRGPVNVTIDSKSKGAQGTSRQLVKVKADSMVYNGATRVLRLSGNVVADIDTTPAQGEGLSMTSELEWIELVLDENSALAQVRTGVGKASVREGGGR